jgi:DNA polymerase
MAPDSALPDKDSLSSLLAWYAEMGVDTALAEEAQDRFAESAVAQRPSVLPDVAQTARPQEEPASNLPPLPELRKAPAVSPPPDPVLARSQDANLGDARAAAAAAATLDDLRAALEAFEGIPLRRTANRLVFGDGNPQARLMLVGEAPGRDEDASGVPFVGRAGHLLDAMLHAIGLDRTGVYIANVVPWRPPGNRTPTPQETELCLPFTRRQIELVNPDILVFLGGSAATTLGGAREGILKLRGRWLEYDCGGRPIRALATLHPAYLLRTPLQKRLAWRDLRAIRATLDSLPPRD